MGRLDGKVALITGGGNGIGEAGARLFVDEGAEVAIADLNADGAERVAAEINELGGTATAIPLDVTDNDSCASAVDAAVDRFGSVDILVNSAGVGSRSAMDMTYEERWEFVIDVNLKGTVLMTRHAVEQMKEQGGGAVVNIASIRGLIGYPAFITDGFNPYPHSKGGVVNATRDMAIGLAKSSIRVNAVCPAFTNTDMTRATRGQSGDLRSDRGDASHRSICATNRDRERNSIFGVGRGFLHHRHVPRDRRRFHSTIDS